MTSQAVRFPLVGRDLLVLANTHAGRLRTNDVRVPGPNALLRRFMAMGIASYVHDAVYQIHCPRLVEACKALAQELPHIDEDLTGPSHLAALATLPDSGGPPRPWETTGLWKAQYMIACTQLAEEGLLNWSYGIASWTASFPSLRRVVQEYRGLYARPLAGMPPDAICIHQRGVESAWAFSTGWDGCTPAGRAAGTAVLEGLATRHVAFRGARELDNLDHLLLQLRAELGVLWDAPAVTSVPSGVIPRIAGHLNLNTLADSYAMDRFDYYGLSSILPEIRRSLYAAAGVPGVETALPIPGTEVELTSGLRRRRVYERTK